MLFQKFQTPQKIVMELYKPMILDALSHEALVLAKKSAVAGNHPFSALLALDGKILCNALNTVITNQDPTQHAEMNLLCEMKKMHLLTPVILERAIFYSSTEPCMMCTGALYWAGIQHIVFVTSKDALAKHAGSDFLYSCQSLLASGSRKIIVEGPTLESIGELIHANYWDKI